MHFSFYQSMQPLTSRKSLALSFQEGSLSFFLIDCYFLVFIWFCWARVACWRIFYFVAACKVLSCKHANSQLQHEGSSSLTGIKPGPSLMGVWSLSQWIMREVPPRRLLNSNLSTVSGRCGISRDASSHSLGWGDLHANPESTQMSGHMSQLSG